MNGNLFLKLVLTHGFVLECMFYEVFLHFFSSSNCDVFLVGCL